MRLPRRTLIATLAISASLLAIPASSSAYVFWSNTNSGGAPSIGRANHDGSGVSQAFATGLTGTPQFMDVADGYVYWGSTVSGITAVIGRADLAGSSVNGSFMGFNTQTPKPGVSVDSTYVYWTDQNASGTGSSGKKVQRVALSNVATGRQNIATWSAAQADAPTDVAHDDTNLYWSKGAAIYRAAKGTVNQSNVAAWVSPSGATAIEGVAVDANYVYYADRTNARIGRIAKSDGTVEPNFIINLGTGLSSPATPTPYGIEIDSNYIYWADPANDVIGRAPIAGSNAPEADFVTGAIDPFGVAVTDPGWDGKFLFWTQDAISAGSQIPGALDVGRALSNGDGVDQEFASDASGTAGLMAGGPNYVYWGTEMPYATGNTRIGRALLDGTDTDGAWKVFGTAAQDRRAVATYGRNLYWVNRDSEAIGRVDLVTESHNGAFIPGIGSYASAIVADSSGIYWSRGEEIWRADTTGSNAALWATLSGSQIEGLASDANYVYFADRTTAQIGRVTKADGTEVTDHVSNLSTGIAAPVTPAPTGIAVDGSYIYWADYANDVIGRAPISGSSTPEGGFVTGLADPIGVALAEPTPDKSLDSPSVGFGERDIDDPPSAPQVVTVTNSGLEPLIVGAPFLTGESAASFEISSDTCSQAAVAPGGTCSISVAFGPSTIGAKLAEMTIPATNSPYGDETVSLSGEGIDPVPPVASITSKPRKAANSNSATFRFQSDIVNSSFQCRLDGRAWTSCASPKTYKSIPFGQHIFRVRAIANSLTGPVASYSWAIKRKRG
jgi:hypothetical protein